MEFSDSVKIGDKELSFEIGGIARQSDGAVRVTCGETVVLVTVCSDLKPKEDINFMPLTVDYLERTYSAGKIPGGFFKREGRPSEKEILISRLIDRPIRPLMPSGYFNETHIVALVLSHDQENDTHPLAICGASCALTISGIPFNGPIGAVMIGLVEGQLIVNPTVSELKNSEMDLMVAGTRSSITMIEGRMDEVDEDIILAAIEIASREIKKVILLQENLKSRVAPLERPYEELILPSSLYEEVVKKTGEAIRKLNTISIKKERSRYRRSIIENTLSEYPEEQHPIVEQIIDEYQKKDMRKKILEEGSRIDGRRLHEIRPIHCEVGCLPRPHGSALFQRGETVSLSAVTLGSKRDEQKLDRLIGESHKRFMVHYNFPPFSVGEARWMRGPGRREIGHGILAERSLQCVIPDDDAFPYTIRLVSDILESNGSSSMATVCACSLAMMDAGIPVKSHVAGISIGLVKEGDNCRLMTDIIGDEDHMGDMDFKAAGTRKGMTGIQLDTKIQDLGIDVVREALTMAKEARLEILVFMEKAIPYPRKVLSEYAPRITKISVPRDKIGAIIGPSGKMIREIISKTGAEIEIEDEEGVVIISADTKDAVNMAATIIKGIIRDVEPGDVYEGEVKKILPFGAIVSIGSGKDGLLHISELAHYHVEKVEDILSVGDNVRVKVKKVDREGGKIDLSRKALIPHNKDRGD
ncbi:polyribonucleotide nucleotidyltransferase [candidate division WOR-3 bacterium]|nr:polyribonucleotide nucleotidyltransferase [candidate division WOR-3 bacterium]